MAELTISKWLGCTKEPVDWLKSHEHDDYYLGTRYKGCHYYGTETAADYPFLTCYPNGEVDHPYFLTKRWIDRYYPGMNCAGFIAHAMALCGGDVHKIVGNYKYANAGNWYRAVKREGLTHYIFHSKEELLKSDKVRKGDILLFMPMPGAQSDGHIVFYWGDDDNRDLMWGSGSPNHITPISDYAPEPFEYMIIPTWLTEPQPAKKKVDFIQYCCSHIQELYQEPVKVYTIWSNGAVDNREVLFGTSADDSYYKCTFNESTKDIEISLYKNCEQNSYKL